jgi:hypothetical protein
MNTTTTTYELVVVKIDSDDPTPAYEVFIYRMIWAGICGPLTESEFVVGGGGYIDYAGRWGFRIDGFPKVNGNTATFALVKA